MNEKIEKYIEDMKGRRLRLTPIAPWEYRLLWYWGLNVRPPIFQSLVVNTMVTGMQATLGFAFAVILLERVLRIFSVSSLADVAVRSMCFGLLIGWWTARGYAKEFKDLELPDWESY